MRPLPEGLRLFSFDELGQTAVVGGLLVGVGVADEVAVVPADT